MTRTLHMLTRASLAGALAVVAAACGSSGSSVSPTGASASAPGGAIVQGTVNASGASTSARDTSSTQSAGIRVTVVGTSLGTQTDGSGRFVLQGVPAGSVTLRFEGPGIDARLTLSGLVDGQVLQIDVRVSGSSATITGRGDPSPGTGEVEFTGTVDSVGKASLVVSGRTVTVGAGTEIKRGHSRITLAEVRVGETAKVEGSQRPDGSVLAREIKVGVEPDDDDHDDDEDEGEDDDDDDDDGGDGNSGSGGGN